LRPRLIVLAALCLLFSAALPPGASGVESKSIEEISACTKANLPESSSVQEVDLESVDRLGSKSSSHSKIYWQKDSDGLSKALTRVTEPPSVRGSATLILQRPDGENPDIFSFLPEIGRVRRVTQNHVSGSFLGTDFSFEDFERLQGLAEDSNRKRLPDQELDGRPVYVLEGTPARGEDSSYEFVRSYIDRETCVTIRTEFFAKPGEIEKILTADPASIKKHEGRNIPYVVRAEDKKEGTHSELRIESVEMDVKIPRKYFSQRALEVRN
jgi:hypothetical protein